MSTPSSASSWRQSKRASAKQARIVTQTPLQEPVAKEDEIDGDDNGKKVSPSTEEVAQQIESNQHSGSDKQMESDKSIQNDKSIENNRETGIKQIEETAKSDTLSTMKVSENVVAEPGKRIFYFDYDTDIISGEWERDIQALLDFIHYYPQREFLIVGHTDVRGTDEYNDPLSLKRANKIRTELIRRGIDEKRLFVMGLGKRKPAIPDAKTETEHHKNRRVELLLIP